MVHSFKPIDTHAYDVLHVYQNEPTDVGDERDEYCMYIVNTCIHRYSIPC